MTADMEDFTIWSFASLFCCFLNEKGAWKGPSEINDCSKNMKILLVSGILAKLCCVL